MKHIVTYSTPEIRRKLLNRHYCDDMPGDPDAFHINGHGWLRFLRMERREYLGQYDLKTEQDETFIDALHMLAGKGLSHKVAMMFYFLKRRYRFIGFDESILDALKELYPEVQELSKGYVTSLTEIEPSDIEFEAPYFANNVEVVTVNLRRYSPEYPKLFVTLDGDGKLNTIVYRSRDKQSPIEYDLETLEDARQSLFAFCKNPYSIHLR